MNLDIEATLEQMSDALLSYCQDKKIENPVMVGIHSGGVWVAERLFKKLVTDVPLATLDITFYRDDFTRAGLHPKIKQTSLPSVEDKHIILVDDVLMSGRTIRAAMNEIFDYGRPASISLAILYDLDQGELPIKADVVGQVLNLNPDQRVKLSGPDPIKVSLIET
ncbi:MAG: bifunctional pyr operon transcriptional regulator/uracil phosphoribosyltransferase PyrR [Marinomonas sp.]|jgi:pyrimidine operon attenuation protein/uracil phosphoribosyltransferase|uniref:bifunctional pyr operon transcriptional regulator/uracil phosphoribosyltransferase PyrR n=1 Tax=unclassified Marinomonas TaxID=196814 RepID=UPI0005F9F57F|nr:MULTISPECIES: bifunctional pyr operon transcriptional regulator/uracil phosphoribosyltransferase PyrR [unclassified Marinomonas]KJZ15790.1 Uracil phosphoribosyltransferase [Marinomonas sp. S3726]KZM40304.1 Uracil phosphoribosyltransferase [Marinomonas sp. SBI22]KZM41721.1 Uracil phosphoribosyltransferase [Marinomonas sp. SBI8L]